MVEQPNQKQLVVRAEVKPELDGLALPAELDKSEILESSAAITPPAKN